MRQIVLDTETTGLEISAGNRLIEIGCVELVNRKLTGRHYHQYVSPQGFKVEEGAFNVHGISDAFLADKPLFTDVMHEFMAFVDGAELVIHNAPFDMGFLNNELKLAAGPFRQLEDYCTVLDTLAMARKKHPGQRNTLDALCKRYGIDNGHRQLHGALLDAEILADVYLLLSGGQTGLALGGDAEGGAEAESIRVADAAVRLNVLKAGSEEVADHEAYLQFLDKKSGDNRFW